MISAPNLINPQKNGKAESSEFKAVKFFGNEAYLEYALMTKDTDKRRSRIFLLSHKAEFRMRQFCTESLICTQYTQLLKLAVFSPSHQKQF